MRKRTDYEASSELSQEEAANFIEDRGRFPTDIDE